MLVRFTLENNKMLKASNNKKINSNVAKLRNLVTALT